MAWPVVFTDDFYCWYNEQPLDLRKRIVAMTLNISVWGPQLGRPLADTVKGSRFSNMKELRVQWCGKPYRLFFVFDPLQRAVVLCGGDKTGRKRFYGDLIRHADTQYSLYLDELERNK